MYQMMIAGLSSGVGKTTVSMGLMAYFSRQMSVQPYKVGPDYIDPAFHTRITGRGCRNLDSYLMDETTIRYLYSRQAVNADMTIVEGVMGIFDGAEVGSDKGTSASIAKTLGLPIILVVNGGKIAGTMGAIMKGIESFDREVSIRGVLFNQVNSDHHYQLLKEAVESATNIKACGYLPKRKEFEIEERHLGLVPMAEQDAFKNKLHGLAEVLAETVDIEGLLSLCTTAPVTVAQRPQAVEEVLDRCLEKEIAEPIRIGIAKDQAFHFYYEDNLQLLKDMGCELIEWSPLHDLSLPKALDGLLIGGGFPEMFAQQLENNAVLREEIRLALEEGLCYVAECGGLMYLGESLVDLGGNSYRMVGVLKGQTAMTKRLQRFGYCRIVTTHSTVYGGEGLRILAHEFHHSCADIVDPTAFEIDKVRKGRSIRSWQGGYMKHNGIASYAHLHYYANPEFALEWIQSMRRTRDR